MDMSSRLRLARKAKGYTQQSLANAIYVSIGVIQNIEYGKVMRPQSFVINSICDTLGINEDWLISGVGDMESGMSKRQRTKLVTEICDSVEKLTVKEQVFVLEMLRLFSDYNRKLKSEGN